MKNDLNKIMDSIVDVVIQSSDNVNVSNSERIISVGAGAFMVWKGVKDTFSKPSSAFIEIVLGSALLYRGVTGYCSVKDRINNLNKVEQKETYIIEAL